MRKISTVYTILFFCFKTHFKKWHNYGIILFSVCHSLTNPDHTLQSSSISSRGLIILCIACVRVYIWWRWNRQNKICAVLFLAAFPFQFRIYMNDTSMNAYTIEWNICADVRTKVIKRKFSFCFFLTFVFFFSLLFQINSKTNTDNCAYHHSLMTILACSHSLFKNSIQFEFDKITQKRRRLRWWCDGDDGKRQNQRLMIMIATQLFCVDDEKYSPNTKFKRHDYLYKVDVP